MGDFRHKRNGSVISEPRNWQEIEVSCDFLNRTDEPSINISELEFAGDVALDIRQRIMNGLNGGVGILEGDPYDIEIGEEGNPVFLFKGYLDYADKAEFVGCNEVKVSLKKRQGTDWINDVADGFSHRYLYSIGVIKDSDFIKTPYIINYIPDKMQLIVLSISLFMMTKELVSTVRSLAETIGDSTDASTPVVGTSVGFGAGVVTAWDIGNVVMTVLKVAAYVAYTIAIVIAIKNLIQELIEQLIPKKRNHLGMSLYTLFERSCQHLGLTLKSKLLTGRKSWNIVPSKDHKGGLKPEGFKGSWKEVGMPGQNDGIDTFGDLIRVWKKVLRADFKIVNNVFYFEREDFFNEVGTYQMPDVFSDQERLLDSFKFNTDEIISNYNINWAYDVQDQNTLNNQEGRVFQVIVEPKIKTNADLVNIKNLEEIDIPFSLGLRKDSLTKIENVIKKIAKFIDKLTAMFNKGTQYAAKIEARKGCLLLSSHFITVPKVVVMAGGNLAMNQRDLLSAKRLWNELHYITSFVEINGNHNQWIRFSNVKVPFCMKSFVTLVGNNMCYDPNTKECKIENFKWKVWDDYATMNFRIKEKYTNNVQLKYLE